MSGTLLAIPEDERAGLPSASSFERIMKCPGSFRLEQHLPDTSNRAAAERGTRIHAAMEGTVKMEALSHSDRICAERLAYQEAELVEELGFEGAEQSKEERLWYMLGEQRLFSGKPDVWHILGKKALVINYKTGHYEPTPIQENCQMLCESILIHRHLQVDEVTAALIHPNVKVGGQIRQHHTHSKTFLKNAAPLFERTTLSALKAGAPRVAGAHCKWCRGKKNNACQVYLDSIQ